MFFSEVEFLERMGLADLNYERKLSILSYLFKKLFKFEFLLIFSLSILAFITLIIRIIIINLKN